MKIAMIGVSKAFKDDQFPQLNRGGEFYFDAVRIFDPLLSMNKTPENENEKEAKAAYLADSELLMQRYEVRDLLIEGRL